MRRQVRLWTRVRVIVRVRAKVRVTCHRFTSRPQVNTVGVMVGR